MSVLVQSVSSLLAAYLLGSFPSGLLIVRMVRGRDVRRWYSGRTGGTNVMRVAGYWAGLATAALDVLKAFLAVRLANWISGGSAWLQVLAGTLAIIGHNYSIFLVERIDGKLRFRGGAGGATAFGASMGLWPPVGLIILAVGAVILFGIGYASVATMSVPIITGVVLALRAAAGLNSWTYVAFGLLAEIVVLWALRPNILRLIAGEERLIGWRARRKQREGNGSIEESVGGEGPQERNLDNG
ncbi:MAG: glycerol-3-phosphate acyltransferase [Anaerolineales bacterium]